MSSDSPAGLGFWSGVARRHFRFILAVGFLTGILTLAGVMLVPRIYVARSSILPPHERTPTLEGLSALQAVLGFESLNPFSAGVSLNDVYLAILRSDRVAKVLIERFDLQEHYHQKNLVKTMAKLRKHSTIVPTREGVIEIKVEDKDARLASDLANAYPAELDRVFRETRIGAGRRQRIFLESRVGEVRSTLDSLDAALLEAQSDKGITALSSDLTEAAMVSGELLGRRLALRIQRDMLEEMGMTGGSAYQEVDLHLRSVEREASRLPVLGLDVARLLRDLKMHEFLYQELQEQLEAARIEEARDTPAVEILDRAVPPDRHSRPRRGLVTLAGILAGSCLALGWRAVRTGPA